MWKVIRYVLYFTVLVLIFSVTYKFREYYYIPFIQQYLDTITDSKLKFRNFSFGYENKRLSLYLYNIEYDNELFIDKAILRFEPSVFAEDYHNLKTPLKSLVAIEVSNFTLIKSSGYLPDGNKPTADNKKHSRKIIDILDIIQNNIKTEVFFDNVNILVAGKSARVTNIKTTVDKQVNVSANLFYAGNYLSTEGTIDIDNGTIISKFQTTSEGFLKSHFNAENFYDFQNKILVCSFNTERLVLGRLSFGKVSAGLTENKDGFKLNADGDFGKVHLETNNLRFDKWSSNGTVKLKDTADVFNADITYKVSKDNNFNLFADIKDIFIFGSRCGSLSVNTNKEKEKINFDCTHSLGNKIIATSQNSGDYKITLYNKQNVIGTFKGNYKKGELSADIKKLSVNKLMFMSSKNKNVTGTLSLYGDIKENGGSITLNATNLSSRRLKKFDVSGILSKKQNKWTCNISTKDKKLVWKSSWQSRQKYNTEFFYSKVDFNNILKIFGMHKIDITGKADGYIKYNSDLSNTEFSVKFKNGTFYKNKFDFWNIAGNVSDKSLNISNFNLSGKDSYIKLKSALSLSQNNPVSYLNASIKNIKVKGANVNGKISFTGHLLEDGEKIAGQLSVEKFKVNGVLCDFKSSAIISAQKIILKGIKNGNNLVGRFVYNFREKNVSATVKIKKSKLSKYYDKIKGFLDLNLSVKGNVSRPKVKFNYKIQNAFYNKIKFSSQATVIGANGILNLKEFEILSADKSGTQFVADGKISINKTDIKFDFKNFSEKEINKFVGFRTPLKGLFYGNGTLSGKLAGLRCHLSIYSDELFVKTMKFNSLNSKIDVYNGKIVLKDGKVKYKDSEIKIPSAQFDIKTGKYFSNFKLINNHFGPLDVFGNLNIDGKIDKRKNGSTYSGHITFENLWINRQVIQKLPLNYMIASRRFHFSTNKKSSLNAVGSIDFNKYPNILFNNILIEDKDSQQSVVFNGKVSDKELNFKTTAKNVESSVIADMFDFPFDIEGNMNITLKSSGAVSAPVISLNANSKAGKISGIKYDTINISLNAKNNMLSIDKFKIGKTGEFSATVKGKYPFAIDPSVKDKIKNSKVDISYEMTDGKMNIIKELTDGEITAKKGAFYIKGSIKGPLKNTTNTGEFIASATSVNTNSYINKFKNLNIFLKWKDNLLKIEEFSAKVGSGLFNVSGNVKLKDLSPSVYDLSIFSDKKGIPVTVKELPIPTSGFFKIEKTDTFTNYSKGVPIFDLKLAGNSTSPKLTGWIKLENTRFCFPSPVDVPDNSEFSISDIFPNMYVDIDLLTGTNTNFENSFVNAYLGGKINIKGNIDNIKANGIVESADGKLSYMGNDFNIINSKIEVINNDIFVTGEAETEVYSAGDSEAEIIKVNVDRSDINDIKIRFSSKNDPTMDSKKALSRLTKTDPTQTSTLDTSTDFLVKQQAVRMLNSNVAAPLAKTILKKTGVVDNVRAGYVNQDTIQIANDEEATIADILYGMKYSVEKNINRLLQIGYSVTFDQVNKESEKGKEKEIDLKHAVELSFKLNKDLFLKGSYGLNSDNEAYEPEKKVMLEQRIRFGGGSKKNK